MERVTLQVLTPRKTVYSGDFDTVILRTTEGDMGILPGHEDILCELSLGTLRGIRETEPVELTVLGGYLSVRGNVISVLTPFADFPENFEESLRVIIREREENKQREEQADLEALRTETALRRALVHMDVSTYALIKGRFSRKIGDDG